MPFRDEGPNSIADAFFWPNSSRIFRMVDLTHGVRGACCLFGARIPAGGPRGGNAGVNFNYRIIFPENMSCTAVAKLLAAKARDGRINITEREDGASRYAQK